MQYYLNSDGSVTSEKRKKKNKNEISSNNQAVKTETKPSLANASQEFKKNLSRSAVQDNGLTLSNVITDLANINDAKNKALESLPGVGNYFKNKNTAKKTVGNFATNMAEGGLSQGLENPYKTIKDWSDAVTNTLTYQGNKAVYGEKRAKEKLAEDEADQEKFLKRNFTKEFENKVGYTDDFVKDWEKDSLVKRDNVAGQVAQGLGGMVPSLVAGQALGFDPKLIDTKGLTGAQKAAAMASNIGRTYVGQMPANTLLAMQGYGGGLSEALNEGATRNQARLFGLSDAAIEQGTEMMTGGVPGLNGTGGIDQLVEPLIGKANNPFVKAGLKSLYSAAGEGLEEYASEMLNPIAKKIYSNEPIDWNDTRARARQAFITGALTGAVLNGPQTLNNFGEARTENQIRKLDSLNETEKNALTEIALKNRRGEQLTQDDVATLQFLNQKANSMNNGTVEAATQRVQQVQQALQNGQITQEQANQELQAVNNVLNQTNQTNQTQEVQQELPFEVEEQPTKRYRNLNDTEANRVKEIQQARAEGRQTQQDVEELNYLERKEKGLKYPELTKSDKINKAEMAKYYYNANMDKFDNTLLNKAENIVEGKKGKRTKQQWLDVAENIGTQARNMDAESLKKYAYESFKEARPNQAENLNKQGQKYVGFGIQEWINAVYDGAGVGKQAQQSDIKQNQQEDSQEHRINDHTIEYKGYYIMSPKPNVGYDYQPIEKSYGYLQIYDANNDDITHNVANWVHDVEDAKSYIDNMEKTNNEKAINDFKKSKNIMDRQTVLNYSNQLNIKTKDGSKIVEKTNMSKLAGKNKKPTIIDISNGSLMVDNNNRIQIRKTILDRFMKRFNNTEVKIIDTGTETEIRKKGIDKTLSRAITTEKVDSMEKLDKIIENGIYKYTTTDETDPNGILYHHFFTPVNYNGNNEVIRTIIKEYPKNPTAKDKYYYHQMEFLEQNKTDSSTLYRSKSEYKAQEPSVSDKNITQKNKNVKLSKQKLMNDFQKLTGDSKLVADAKIGRYQVQLAQKEAGNFDGEVQAPYSEEAMKLYKQIENARQTSSHLYHSTPADRIQSIVENGLQIGSKQNQEGVSSENKLYLSATEELARSFTPNDEVTLRIKPSANLENLDYDLLGGEGSYTITNNIEPKYLQVKENGKWVDLLKSEYAKSNTIQPTNDYENYQSKLKDKIAEARKTAGDDFANNLEQQMEEYNERHPLENDIYKVTKSKPADNINDSFFKDHISDFDGKTGTKTQDGTVTSMKLQKGDNLAKLSFTENEDKIWIDELYIKNQKQGYGSEIVNAIKDYANRKGKYVEAFKELSSASGFWDKTLRNVQQKNEITKQSITKDNKGRTLTKDQQDFYKGNQVVDKEGNLLTLYHGTGADFTVFDRDMAGNHGTYYGAGFYLTPNSEGAADYARMAGGENGKVMELYVKMTNPYKPTADIINKDGTVTFAPSFYEDFENRFKDSLPTDWSTLTNRQKGRAVRNVLQDNGYDGIINGDTYVAFEPNQVKNANNLHPTANEDIRKNEVDTNYEENAEQKTWQNKVNSAMTMDEARQMLERAFTVSDMKEYTDGEISNIDEWVNNDDWNYQIPMIIENTYELQSKYINSNPDILDDVYTIDDVIDAYKNGTLIGKQKVNKEFDLSKTSDYEDTRFYAPQDTKGGKELFKTASQRVTNSNRQEVYRARGNLIINAHNEGYLESIGLTQEEFNKKLRSWSDYTPTAKALSEKLNKGVAKQNQWTGIENSSIVNTLGITDAEMESLVKEVKGTSNDWEKRYITSTMLALDTHIDYKNLTFDFAPDRAQMGGKALADYNSRTDTIRVKDSGQNTIAHEMGHYLDHLWGREIFGNDLGITRRTTNLENLTDAQKDFVNNFYNFFDDIEATADIGSSYKMEPTEVFARFTARFVEWTKNVATNNRYGNYEAQWYKDNFTRSQFESFAKILQQKSYLDTIDNSKAEFDYSKRNGTIVEQQAPLTPQEVINNFKQAQKGKIDTIKLRSWVNTSNEATNNQNTLSQADKNAITYEVQSNKKTAEMARKNTDGLTYEQKVFRAQNKLNSNQKVTAVDLAEAQMALLEASERGDVKTYLNLQQDIAIMGTELGQAVQAMSMIQRMSPDGQIAMLNKIVDRQQKRGNKNFEGVQMNEELVQKVLDSYDDASHTTFNKEQMDQAVDELKQDIANQMKVSKTEKINAWRYLSMLGNPKTHIRNVVANGAMTVVKRFKDTLAATGQDLFIKDKSQKTTTLKKASKDVMALADVAYNETFNKNQRDSKYNEMTELESKRKIFNNKAIEAVRKFNDAALSAEDQAFKKINFKKSFSKYLTAQGISTSEQINTNPEIIEAAKAFALQEAKVATFNQENKLAQKIIAFDNLNPVARVVRGAIIPFARTPLNIAKTGIEYTPGVGLATTYADFKKAPQNMKGAVLVDGLSKQITGTSLALLGYALAKSGILTGSAGDDKEDKFEKDQGAKMDYSIKIGDTSYDLSWLSPSSMPLFVGARMYEILDKQEGLDENVLIESLASTLDPLSELSCISSFTKVLQSYQQGSMQMISEMSKTTAQNYISQFIPTVSSQFARVFDDTKRTTNADRGAGNTFTQETMRQLQYKIPGLRNFLPESTDYFGNDRKENENVLIRAWEAFLSPANTKKDTMTEESKELVRLYKETGNDDVIPSGLQKYINFNNNKYDMSSKEYNQFKKDYGTAFQENLKELMNTNDYRMASDDERAEMIAGIMKYAKDKSKDNYLTKQGEDYSKTTSTGQKSYYESDKVDNLTTGDFGIADYYIYKSKAPKVVTGNMDTVKNKIAMTKVVGIDPEIYNDYLSNVGKIESDYYSNGKSIPYSKQRKTFAYINSLPITAQQKAILFKQKYPSYKAADKQIYNLIQNSDLSVEEKYSLAAFLKFE